MRELQKNATGASRTAAAPPMGPVQYKRGLIVATIAGLLMTFFGAFGTGAVPLGTRLAYWLIIMESGALIGIGATTGVRSWGRLAERPVREGALISLLIALPLTMVVAGTTTVMLGGRPPSAASLAGMFVAVLVVTGVITAVNYATVRTQVAVEPVASDSPPPARTFVDVAVPAVAEQTSRARLLDRLPPHLRCADLYAIQSEDHYLRVHTSAGSNLILLRMSDALAELEGVDGARTHRSWWVARAAVQTVERSDGRAELTLPGNVVAPVSRSFMRSLQEQHWFA